jgi:hypothetical protein
MEQLRELTVKEGKEIVVELPAESISALSGVKRLHDEGAS